MKNTEESATAAQVDGFVVLLVPPLELAKLWGELIEAYHGCNGFGGDTAELYSFRFQRMHPIVAARCLHSLVEVFCSEMGCSATIDGIDPDEWIDAMSCNQDRFNHRSHVRIIAT